LNQTFRQAREIFRNHDVTTFFPGSLSFSRFREKSSLPVPNISSIGLQPFVACPDPAERCEFGQLALHDHFTVLISGATPFGVPSKSHRPATTSCCSEVKMAIDLIKRNFQDTSFGQRICDWLSQKHFRQLTISLIRIYHQ
jgi:hypothetical protein